MKLTTNSLFLVIVLCLVHFHLASCFYFTVSNPFNWNWFSWYRNRNATDSNSTTLHNPHDIPSPLPPPPSSQARSGYTLSHEENRLMGNLHFIINKIRRGKTLWSGEVTTTTSTTPTTTEVSPGRSIGRGEGATGGDHEEDLMMGSSSEMDFVTVVVDRTEAPTTSSPTTSSESLEQTPTTIVPIELITTKSKQNPTTTTTTTSSVIFKDDDDDYPDSTTLDPPQWKIFISSDGMIREEYYGALAYLNDRKETKGRGKVSLFDNPPTESRETFKKTEEYRKRQEAAKRKATATVERSSGFATTTIATIQAEVATSTSKPESELILISESAEKSSESTTVSLGLQIETTTTSELVKIQNKTDLVPSLNIDEGSLPFRTTTEQPEIATESAVPATELPETASNNELFMEKLIKLQVEQTKRPKKVDLLPTTTTSPEIRTEESVITTTSVEVGSTDSAGIRFFKFVPLSTDQTGLVVTTTEEPTRNNKMLPFAFYDLTKTGSGQTSGFSGPGRKLDEGKFVASFQDLYSNAGIFDDLQQIYPESAPIANNYVDLQTSWFDNAKLDLTHKKKK